MTSRGSGPRHAMRGQDAPEGVHGPFVLSALWLAVMAGFTLAVALPVEAALGRLSLGWIAHAQVHGHIQVVGFAGLFVIGVATRLAPGFGGRPLAAGRLISVAFWLLLVGLVGRAIGQPLANHPPFALLMTLGAVAEALGALAALAVVAGTLRPWSQGTTPSAALLTASMAWLVVQAAVGSWWLFDLGREHQRILPSDRDALLLQLQVFGFLLSALIGVGLRTFPSFFGARLPQGRYVWLLAGLLQGGVAMWAAGLLLGADGGQLARSASAAGQLAVGAAMLGMAAAAGWWKRGNRLAPASRHFIWSLRMLLGWLTVTGGLLTLTAVRALSRDEFVSTLQLDAIRHVFLIGVITLGITVMGQLILPEFASERLVRTPAKWRGWAFGVALSVAALLRGVVPLAGLEGEPRHWLMSVAGLAGLGSVAAFGWLYFSARTSHRVYLAKIAVWRKREVPLV